MTRGATVRRGSRQGDEIMAVGGGRVYRPQGVRRIRRAAGYASALTVGLLFVVLGSALALDNVKARLHFDDADEVPAVVVEADYTKPHLKQSPEHVGVALADGHRTPASIDDVAQAPDGLSPGDHVTVLHDAARPGHALFPSQLGWGALMFPGGMLLLCGLVPTVVYGLALARVLAARLRR
ncbi:DUF3592 domain-containing protein [Streptomyces sp. NPDC051985]|uniref:DUF3592 domain-containing protein n=1 Tax=Streptomyces sp. NPDC051985 TaxID=3155807 RepID=UPI003445BD3E